MELDDHYSAKLQRSVAVLPRKQNMLFLDKTVADDDADSKLLQAVAVLLIRCQWRK